MDESVLMQSSGDHVYAYQVSSGRSWDDWYLQVGACDIETYNGEM